jgi:large subunit ribosomal protein L13
VNTLSFKTISANENTVKRNWYVVDATNMVVGRGASRIAHTLRGKNKPYFTPHVDCGDYVIVINAEKVRFTGNKMNTKEYVRHSHYPGGRKVVTFHQMIEKHPIRVVEKAVKLMLPKNKLGDAMYRKLFVYAGNEHPHAAQNPQPLKID